MVPIPQVVPGRTPWGPTKRHKQGSHFINKWRLLEVVQFPCKYVLLGSLFGKSIYLIGPEMVPWLLKKSEDQSGDPRTILQVFGDEVSFQYFHKTWKSTSPMSCKTKPCQSSMEILRMVHPLPPDTPRPPKYQPELWKKQFLWNSRFSIFWQFLHLVVPYRPFFWDL